MTTRSTGANGESTRIRMLCVTPYPRSSADTRYRIEQFLPGLSDAGIDGEVHPFMSERMFAIYAAPGQVPSKLGETAMGVAGRFRDIVAARRFDCVFIHKEAFPFGPPLLERALRAACRGPLLLDLDERQPVVVQHDEHEFFISFFEALLPPILAKGEDARKKLEEIGTLDAKFLVRVKVAASRFESFVNVLQQNLDNFRKEHDANPAP